MSRIIDFPDGFTSATEPTTAGAIASFAETFATDAAFEAVYGAPPYSNAGFYFNSTVGKVRIHDGTDWRTNEQAEDNASASDPTINDDSNAGYSVLSLWLNTSSGALFRAVDVTVGAAVWTELAADAVLDAHINSTSAHGATGEVVGTTNSQTLTNKTLTAPSINGGDTDYGTASNTNRLTIPSNTKANLDALTRKEGTVVYATDEDKFYIDDGVTLNEVSGAGGGGGGLDTWLVEDFETTVAADFSTGNSATFQGGGTLDGVLSDETIAPLSGASSLKYVAGASSLNDYFASPAIDVDFKQQDNDSGFTFYFTWDGTTDIEAVVWDETNSSKLNSVLDVINTADGATRYSASFYPPSTCTQVRYGFHILEAPTNGDALIVDDVEFSTNPFQYKNIGRENIYSAKIENNGTVTLLSESSEFISSVVRDGLGLVTVNFISGFFSEPPAVIAMTADNAGTDRKVEQNSPVSVNSIQFRTSSAATNPAFDVDFDFILQRQGADYGQTTEHVVTPAASQTETAIYNTHAGFGSTAVRIPYFTNTVVDTFSDILTADNNSTNGLNFVAKEKCVVTASFTGAGASLSRLGWSINADGTNQLTSLSSVNRLAIVTGDSANEEATATISIIMEKGDILRPHCDTFTAAVTLRWHLTITATKFDASFLSAVPVQKVVYLKDSKAVSTQGGTFTSGSYQTRDLNLIEGDSSLVSLTSNQFTLSKGRYCIEAHSECWAVNANKLRIQNITDSTTSIIGKVGNSGSGSGGDPVPALLMGSLEISSQKTFELQHRCQTTKATNGFGVASGFDDEVYTQVKITKLR